jgi:thiosulfate/3-mercaptopyruvate sulfurtransferase
MPGARNIPFGALINEQGQLRPADELKDIFASAGAELSSPTICTCGSGVTAAVIALALARLGRWEASIYDGAWAEWGATAHAPVTTGPA